MIGSEVGYWEEVEFAAGQADAGDPMWLRAAQAAAELLAQFEILCSAADVLRYGGSTNEADISRFTSENLSTFDEFAAKMQNSFDPDQMEDASIEVLPAWMAVRSFTDEAVNGYRAEVSSANDSLPAQRDALQALGERASKLPELSLQLSGVFGSSVDKPEELAAILNAARSESMAREAASSGRVGVWKVGHEHIKDLARVKVDTSLVNVISKGAFNTAFTAWEIAQKQQEGRQLEGQQ